MDQAIRIQSTDRVAVTATQRKRVTILGSTGSVGSQTLDLIERAPEKYEIIALTARSNIKRLVEQARRLHPELVVIADESQYQALKEALADTNIAVAAGAKAIEGAAGLESDWLMSAIVGYAGLPATLAAARRGGVIAFANKETLVCAGPLMMKLVSDCGAKLLPVDSEHNAIWQVFDFERPEAISRLILTASGGPFREASLETMAKATPQQAVKHPVWSMGAKISVDSATLMNKALEVIEAHFLFSMSDDKIDVLVHPQSVIHSMVEYQDGSVLAQMGTPDMRIPIGYTLAWPERMSTPAAKLDLAAIGKLTFETPDLKKFPALSLMREVMRKGGTAPAILNAANEIAVEAFLEGRIGFLDIVKISEATLKAVTSVALANLEGLEEANREARSYATQFIRSL